MVAALPGAGGKLPADYTAKLAQAETSGAQRRDTGFGTRLVGMILVLPLLGHATWYAYRDLGEEA